MTGKKIKISRQEQGIVRVTLNRPEIHNAFDDQLIAQLTTTLKELDQDLTVRVLILDAAGTSFSAGADLHWMKKMAGYSKAENLQDSEYLADLMASLYHMKCSTIAAVQGAAYGGGVGLVACCDIALASTNASFCLSEVKLGLIPAVISPYVIAAMGERAAKRYFVTAERFDAKRAAELGLISEWVNPEDLEAKVMSLAELILMNGPEAVMEAKQLIRDVADKAMDIPLKKMTAERIAAIRASRQGKEGVNAFLEKRPANWEQR
jgi:methylglutaconyl-CoA hydratase